MNAGASEDPPCVSLIIVNFDRVVTLRLLLKSLEFQRYPNFEIIVVTNLSEEERPRSPLPIRWVAFCEANISAARNRGIAAAAGEIVAFCDDDAVPEFGWLDALVPAFRNPQVGSAGGFVRGRNGVSLQWAAIWFDRLGRDRKMALTGSGPHVFPPKSGRYIKTVGTNCAFRRDALVGIGGFDEAFRFYHDEADVDLNLAKAGWHAAIVPEAEVHHGYAEGPHRTRRRVPKSLFEIGASEVAFARFHGPEGALDGHRARVRRHQARRLDRLFVLGLVSGAEMRRLLAGLEDGFAAGLERMPTPGVFSDNAAAFQPVPAHKAERHLIITGPFSPRTHNRVLAAKTADTGAEVTLVEVELSHRNLMVHFQPEGYWRHRFGLLGHAERDRPRPFAGVSRRIHSEISRVAVQRGLDCEP